MSLKKYFKAVFYEILALFGIDRRKVNNRARLRRKEDWPDLLP